MNLPALDDELNLPQFHSEASDDEMTKSEIAAAQALIKSTFENLTKDKSITLKTFNETRSFS
jgi:hypothetical protein